MKTLGKFNINSEKIIKNEELVTLRGGSGQCCVCINNTTEGRVMGYMGAPNQEQCEAACNPLGWIGTYGSWTYC